MTQYRQRWTNPFTNPRLRALYRQGYLWRYSPCGNEPPPTGNHTPGGAATVLKGYKDADAVISANTPDADEDAPTDN